MILPTRLDKLHVRLLQPFADESLGGLDRLEQVAGGGIT